MTMLSLMFRDIQTTTKKIPKINKQTNKHYVITRNVDKTPVENYENSTDAGSHCTL